jgi:hypothetical protein
MGLKTIRIEKKRNKPFMQLSFGWFNKQRGPLSIGTVREAQM